MIHNHHGQTRPDEKMGTFKKNGDTSAQLAVIKKRAAKKRRQRDHDSN